MSTPGSARAEPPLSGPSARVTVAAHRYFLPAAGGAALTFGTLFLIGVEPPSVPLLALALMVVGGGSLLTAFSFRLWQLSLLPPPTARVARRRGSSPPPVQPHGSAPRRERTPPDWSIPHSGIGRSVVSASAPPPAGIWEQWEPASHPALGAALVGPVPSTAYLPPRVGAIAPFAARDEGALIISESRTRSERWSGPQRVERSWDAFPPSDALDRYPEGEPMPDSDDAHRLTPFSAEDLDLLFPPVERSTLDSDSPPEVTLDAFLGEFPHGPATAAAQELALAPPHSAGEPEPTSGADFGALSWGQPGLGVGLAQPDHELYLEAINPVPPHLRSGERPAAPTGPRASDRSGAISAGGRCSACSNPVVGFRSWTPCPRCLRPVCRDCLAASLIDGGDGECPTCRPGRSSPAG